MTGSDSLFQVLSHPDFLAMKGLANEVPIFIKTYAPRDEEKMQELISATATRLETAGIPVAVMDLFELVLDNIAAEGRLERVLDAEAGMNKQKMIEMLNAFADPESRLIPLLTDRMGQPDPEPVPAGVPAQAPLPAGAPRARPGQRIHLCRRQDPSEEGVRQPQEDPAGVRRMGAGRPVAPGPAAHRAGPG